MDPGDASILAADLQEGSFTGDEILRLLRNLHVRLQRRSISLDDSKRISREPSIRVFVGL